MTSENIDLNQTKAAFAGLRDSIAKLDYLVVVKKDEIAKKDKEAAKKMKKNESDLSELRAVSENTINNIDDIISKISRVLEKDGADNNNN